MIDTEDYTQSVEQVVYKERPYPLGKQDMWELFDEWCEANTEALEAIEIKALELDRRFNYVGAKYLLEWLRNERPDIKIVRIPYIDQYGTLRNYRLNNTFTPALGRYLVDKYPEMHIELKPSRWD